MSSTSERTNNNITKNSDKRGIIGNMAGDNITKPKLQWNPVLHLLRNNPIRADMPYQCSLFYHNGTQQCPNFIDQQKRIWAIEHLDNFSRRDIRNLTDIEIGAFLMNFRCGKQHPTTAHMQERNRATDIVRKVIEKTYGVYEARWARLRECLIENHGSIEEAYTFVRWIVFEVHPNGRHVKDLIPWPVSSSLANDVTPDAVCRHYKRAIASTGDGIKRTELEKLTHGIEILKGEKRRWAPLQEIFGEMKRVIALEGFVFVVAECVEVVRGVIGEMLGVLEGAQGEGFYPFDEGEESPYRPKVKKERGKGKRVRWS